MATQLQWRRGTTAEHATFTGANAEVTVDTDKETLVVHDGATAGGFPLVTQTDLSTAIAAIPASEPINSLTQLTYPSADGGFRDLYRSGFLPSSFNQQWGGSQWGELPDDSMGSVATGNIQDDSSTIDLGSGASSYYRSTGFKVSETETYNNILVKLSKYGNPTGNITARIYSDNAGSPNAALGAAVTFSCKRITSKSDGEFYPLTGFNVALTAGTQYHLVLQLAVDASNYVLWKATLSSKYPHGFINSGTSAPVWTPTTGRCLCFVVVNPTANSLLQSGGMFDYKLSFNPGSPWNQSRSLSQPLSNFYDGKNFTALHRGTYAISTNVWDFGYGLDHDRITLTINASGYPVLSIYESDRTLAQVTGTGSVTTGDHDIGVRVRTVGDGADYATLYVDGVSVGTPLTSQTFTMDKNFRALGTARLGDGFGIIPAWTQDMQMTSLPSAQGWTWSGTGTEANAMSIQGGKLYQNKSGYTSTDQGYYTKTTAFNNTVGWTVLVKPQVTNDNNTSNPGVLVVDTLDGTKRLTVYLHEYFITSGYSATIQHTYQCDLKSRERIVEICGKGSDYYVFLDGQLVIDGTGLLISATASNVLNFGDYYIGAGENSDAIWSYVKYYQGGMILPIATTGSCSEFAHWSGDKSSLFAPLWNSGSPVSVKQLCGVEKNYIGEGVVQKEVRRGVTGSPTTSSTTTTLLPEMECYTIGKVLDADFLYNVANATVQVSQHASQIAVDGFGIIVGSEGQAVANTYTSISLSKAHNSYLGLHKVEGKWNVNSGTDTNQATIRNLMVEAKA